MKSRLQFSCAHRSNSIQHRPSETPSHTGIKTSVVAIVDRRKRTSAWLTRYAYTQKAIAPNTIDRASVAAYSLPCRAIVIPTVASAIEGAAPKRPAKLFGRKTSPSSANTLITAPPMRNLSTNSSSLSRLLCLLDQRLRLCNPLASQQLVLLALQSVIVDEEILQLAQELLW